MSNFMNMVLNKLNNYFYYKLIVYHKQILIFYYFSFIYYYDSFIYYKWVFSMEYYTIQ
jgi:hypothetical protein